MGEVPASLGRFVAEKEEFSLEIIKPIQMKPDYLFENQDEDWLYGEYRGWETDYPVRGGEEALPLRRKLPHLKKGREKDVKTPSLLLLSRKMQQTRGAHFSI